MMFEAVAACVLLQVASVQCHLYDGSTVRAQTLKAAPSVPFVWGSQQVLPSERYMKLLVDGECLPDNQSSLQLF